MKNKRTATIVLSAIAVIGGMVLNFNEFLMGNPASMKNLLVTLAYIAIWVFVLIIGIRNKNREIMRYCSAFWIITLLTSILAWYANATDAIVDWAIPFVILLLSQLYGIDFFVQSPLTVFGKYNFPHFGN
jgi:uncharacterized membrane protein